jgi:hypothetical protein
MDFKSINIKKINTDYIFYLVFIITIVIGVYFRLIVLDYSFVNEWAARDFDRAFNIFDGNYIPLAGPEYDNGGRLPGPFLYFLLLLPIFIDYSYDSIIVFNFAFNLAGMVLFFWVVKRFFDKYVAILSSIFVLIYLPFVQVFGFPINPAFIFPFIVIFIWLLLEITLNQNYKCIPLALLALSLGIQLHFSVSTFYAVLLLNLILFRIKIPWRFIWISIVIVALCFAPYFAYKKLYYISSDIWLFKETGTIKGITDWSLSEILKIVFLNKTILRLTSFNGLSYWVPFSNKAVAVYFFLFYSTLFIYIFNICKKGVRFSKKELIVFSCFFIPALIYEIIHPKFNHNWYSYIFIYPLLLIISIAIIDLYKAISKISRIGLTIGLAILICILISDAYVHLKIYKRKVSINSHKNSQSIFKFAMRSLSLNSKEFVERVFFDSPIQPFSVKRLELLNNNPKSTLLKKQESLPCLYLSDSRYKNMKKSSLYQDRMNSFFNNEDLQTVNVSKRLSFINMGWIKIMDVYEYVPKNNNRCYRNLMNPFQVTKGQKDLLTLAKKTQINGPISINQLDQIQEFGPNSNLTFLKGNYIVVNNLIKLPIGVKLLIKKNQGKYLVTVEMDGYAYSGNNPTKEIGLLVSSKTPSGTNITKKLKMNFNKLFENPVYSTNFSWRQNFYLPEKSTFTKNNFDISLFWDIEHSNNVPQVYSTNSFQAVRVSLTNITKEIKKRTAPSKVPNNRNFNNFLDYLIK